jgi:hypothetical protein
MLMAPTVIPKCAIFAPEAMRRAFSGRVRLRCCRGLKHAIAEQCYGGRDHSYRNGSECGPESRAMALGRRNCREHKPRKNAHHFRFQPPNHVDGQSAQSSPIAVRDWDWKIEICGEPHDDAEREIKDEPEE